MEHRKFIFPHQISITINVEDITMSAAALKYGRFSPSSVAQEWSDKGGNKGSPIFSFAEDTFSLSQPEVRQFPYQLQISEILKVNDCLKSDIHESGNHVSSAESKTANQTATNKCRQLPCRTFVSTGSCPYGDRCVFLHDPCIVSKPVYIKIKVRKDF
jgi:hypothetical protein